MGRIPLHRLPSRSVDAPSIDKSAERALKVLDRDLVVFFSRFLIMHDCAVAHDDHGNPGMWPRWHVALWSERDDRFYKILTIQTPEMEYAQFDHRTVRLLQGDIVRVKGMKAAINHRAEQREAQKEANRKAVKESRELWFEENRGKVGSVAADPTGGYQKTRDPKIFGFSWQTNRTMNRDSIERTPEELGYKNDPLTGGNN